MLCELRLSRKALATLPAREWPLLAVGALVGLQDAFQAEALVALGTLEGPLSAVHPQVLPELALMGEGSATLPAGEWPFSTVLQLVGPQPALQMEVRLTHCASKGFFLQVKPLAPQQLSLLAAVPSTLGTLERFLLAEDSGVFCESAMLGESLTTLSTEEWPLSTTHMLVDVL